MARLALIENGYVANIILGEPGFAGGIECGYDVGIGWSYDGEVFSPPPSPPPPPQPDPTPPLPICCAAAFGITVSDGSIDVIEASAGVAAAFYLGVGSYLLFFTKPQADTNYYPKVFNGQAKMQTVDKGEDYILISATDSNGDPVDPDTFSVEIWRVN